MRPVSRVIELTPADGMLLHMKLWSYRLQVPQFTSVKPISLLVRDYNRTSICELLLWKLWNGLLDVAKVDNCD